MNTEKQPSGPMLRTPDAAEYCGIAASTLEKLRLTGGGPAFSKLGKTVIYRRADIDEWVASHRRTSTSDCVAA